MQRTCFLILVSFGMTAATFGQSTSSDSKTMQALLSEVHELRQDLHSSLDKLQVVQILLARLQIQEVAVTRASQHLDDARAKLAELQLVIKSETAEVKHLEEASPNGNETQAQIDEALSRAKADLDASTSLAQQRQAIETEAEQQLRTEREKLERLENQLDELVRAMGNASEQSKGPSLHRPEASGHADSRK
jgi:chromosome segregation ATPase